MWTPAFLRIPCYPLRLVCIFVKLCFVCVYFGLSWFVILLFVWFSYIPNVLLLTNRYRNHTQVWGSELNVCTHKFTLEPHDLNSTNYIHGTMCSRREIANEIESVQRERDQTQNGMDGFVCLKLKLQYHLRFFYFFVNVFACNACVWRSTLQRNGTIAIDTSTWRRLFRRGGQRTRRLTCPTVVPTPSNLK